MISFVLLIRKEKEKRHLLALLFSQSLVILFQKPNFLRKNKLKPPLQRNDKLNFNQNLNHLCMLNNKRHTLLILFIISL